MTLQFSSKEIHFLKTDTDERLAGPPETYYSDRIHARTDPMRNFERRLEQSHIPKDAFLCSVVRISEDLTKEGMDHARDTFEACFEFVMDRKPEPAAGKSRVKRGIWETLDEKTFVLAFWDYSRENQARNLISSLKEKISTALDTRILMGAALSPFHGFDRSQTLGNALKALDHAAFFGPDQLIYFDAVSLNISGDRLYQLKMYKEAIKEYTKGLELAPRNINLMNSLGVCYGVTGELDRAMEEFEKARSLSPEEVMVVYNIGLIHRIREDMDKAVMYLKKAHAVNPDIFEVELLLGQLLLKKRNYDLARTHLQAALNLNPESGAAARMMGELFLEQENAVRAAQEFNRAVKLNPADAAALSGYAKAMNDQGKNLKIALTFARKSLSLEPGNTVFKARLEEITRSFEKMEQQKEPRSA